MTLTFVHLSDIHFNHRHSTNWDPDEDLRRELLRDLRDVTAQLGRADHLLITGDIAFSGKASEYESVGDWLSEVVDVACQDGASILTVPGNHDVDRSVADGRRTVRLAQERVRSVPDDELDHELEESLNDRDTGPVLLSPLAAYNTFAAQFGCQISPSTPWWERTFALGHGYDLKLRGATSVLVSDQDDDENSRRLSVPTQMMTLPRDPWTVSALLAHHPREWLRRRDQIGDILDARARLQFFGHRHVFRLRQEAGNLIVHAGATHPERDYDWQPHYNVLQLETVPIDGLVALRTIVHPRRWYPRETCFGVDTDPSGKAHRTFDLHLSTASRQSVAAARQHVRRLASASVDEPSFDTQPQAPSTATRHRRHVVKMPRMDSIFEATVTRWLKNEGDAVEENEPLYDLATDKFDIEVPSPVAGVLVQILVHDGETVVVDSDLAVIEY
jgi:biotin carboxyl carrier protein/predicted phosphodiesterase